VGKKHDSDFNRLIMESVKKEMIWQGFQKKYYNKVLVLENKGYPKDMISEAVYVDALQGLVKTIMGTGTTSAATGSSGTEAFRKILKEQVLQYLLSRVGVDPDSAKGSIIRNGIQEVLKTMTDQEFKDLLKGGSRCTTVAMKIGDILGVAVKDGLKEKLFTDIVGKVFSDFADAKNNVLFAGLFISMREKFSDALEAPLNNAIDNFFDSGEFNQKAAEMVCSMSLVDMIKSINPNFVGDATEYLASKPADYLTSLMSE
jgi:hypothetical protein